MGYRLRMRQKRLRRLDAMRLKHKPSARKSIVTHKLLHGRTGSMQAKLRRNQPKGRLPYRNVTMPTVLADSTRGGLYNVR